MGVLPALNLLSPAAYDEKPVISFNNKKKCLE